MAGYKDDFLGSAPEHRIDLPHFTPELARSVLEEGALREDVFADYATYSVAMHQGYRAPLYAALNIHREGDPGTKRKDKWRIDERVGTENQLGPEYYSDNPWDRGHIAMREAAAWGPDRRAAQIADDDTFYYTNSALQHENFNRDEWVELEKWVLEFAEHEATRVTEFTGPIFGDFMRTIRPTGRSAAFVPSAFFKVIAFVNEQLVLETRAFIVMQDEVSLADRKGRKRFNNQIYQVSVAEVEERTGLQFDNKLANANPIWFSHGAKTPDVANLDVTEAPEARDINGAEDIILSATQDRPNAYRDDQVPIYIAGAMVNPAGAEPEGEWVSLLNLSGEAISIEGWALQDRSRRSFTLSGEIGPGQARRIEPMGAIRLVNAPSDTKPGLIILNDENGDQVDRVSYRKKDMPKEGAPLVFAYTYTD
jgi:endonuclease G